jgi:hypothetical protein
MTSPCDERLFEERDPVREPICNSLSICIVCRNSIYSSNINVLVYFDLTEHHGREGRGLTANAKAVHLTLLFQLCNSLCIYTFLVIHNTQS